MRRFYTQTGQYPKIDAAVFMAGPQSEDQVNPEVVALLARPGIQRVAVFYNHGVGDRVEIYTPIPEPSANDHQ